MQETIEAAGAVVFRRHANSGDLEVCLVHRPKYDDWSFPKGKLEAHESLAHAAVREVGEETGVPIRLAQLLAEVTYPLHADGSEGNRDKSRKAGKRRSKKKDLIKHVVYWVGVPLDTTHAHMRQDALGARIEQDKEADTVEWMSSDAAAQRLTYDSDRAVLQKFSTLVSATQPEETATVIIVRHGKAESRKRWSGTEALRPLTPLGAGASFALSRELACFGIADLVTSPWTRCAQTLIPYAASCQLDMTEIDDLTEDTVAADPDATTAAIREIFRRALSAPSEPVAVCTHRPVFEKIFPQIAAMCATKKLASAIPTESPYLQTAYGLAFSVILTNDEPTITAIQRVENVVY
ncbi:MAG: NUDIX hydrolase [Bifidobacteriaceae bacterium]|jgi:8-oxo-dGTP diphosphatase|nr:NUDIX hydrolase [Bifidobacteriaceae bacterium]